MQENKQQDNEEMNSLVLREKGDVLAKQEL
jgi:hypothetical protein